MNEMIKLNPPERCRIYHFANGRIELKNVISISISDSGTHRLELADGKKFIVKKDWLAIELDVDSWTF